MITRIFSYIKCIAVYTVYTTMLRNMRFIYTVFRMGDEVGTSKNLLNWKKKTFDNNLLFINFSSLMELWKFKCDRYWKLNCPYQTT